MWTIARNQTQDLWLQLPVLGQLQVLGQIFSDGWVFTFTEAWCKRGLFVCLFLPAIFFVFQARTLVVSQVLISYSLLLLF